MPKWKYAISSADFAPASAPILLQGTICENLEKAAKLGYQAIEVHTRETAVLDYDEIRRTSERCGAKVGMVITGRLYTEGLCGLMDDRPYVTKAALDGMDQYLAMAEKLDAGIIIGWLRGKMPAGARPQKYLERLGHNMKLICERAAEKKIPVSVEVINRYEVDTFTTARELMEFIDHYAIPNCYVHLDTFHMGIDELDPLAAIRSVAGRLGYIHFADSTRQHPGSGQFDFVKIMQELKNIDYSGYVSVECLVGADDGMTAAKKSMDHILACEKKLV